MTSHTEVLLILPHSRPSREAIPVIHQWLLRQGARVEVGEGHYYCLGYVEGYDYQCHDTWDAEATLRMIAGWPQAGFLDYNILGTTFLVSYNGTADHLLSGVLFSAWEPEYQWNPPALDKLFGDMQQAFGAAKLLKGDCFTDQVDAHDIILAFQEGRFESEVLPELRPYLELDLNG